MRMSRRDHVVPSRRNSRQPTRNVDGPDLLFSAMEISQAMSIRTKKDQRSIVRMAKFLNCWRNKGSGKNSSQHTILTAHTDPAWAGRRSRRESTSGGVVSTTVGVVKHWSSTQRLVSCEAKLQAMNKGAAEAMEDGITFDVVLSSEASAMLGVVNTRGVGKARPIDTQELWVQKFNTTSRIGGAEGRRQRERRGHAHRQREISGTREAHGRRGIHQDNKTRDGHRVDGCT